MLEAARWAPSWANTQTWEFVVVRDKSLMEKISSTYSGTNPARKCTIAASALIVGCAKKGMAGSKNGVDVTKYSEWFMFDMGIAAQNICLKGCELGLGTVVVGLMDHDACKKLLSVPDDFEVVVVIPVGKPEAGEKQPTPRKKLESFVHLNKFGMPFIK
jgi:nitroreductase